MKDFLIFTLIASLAFALCIGIVRFKRIDAAMRVLVVLLMVLLAAQIGASIFDLVKKYSLKNVVFNLSCLTEMFLQTLFFIYAIRPNYLRKLVFADATIWPVIWLLNIIFLQPISELNTNFLLIESFCTITLSLYFIYWLLRNSVVRNVFQHPHFWVAALWLLLWSITFFFWVFVKTLYSDRWPYINFAMHFQAAANIIVYMGIGLVLWLYPKKGTNESV